MSFPEKPLLVLFVFENVGAKEFQSYKTLELRLLGLVKHDADNGSFRTKKISSGGAGCVAEKRTRET